MLSPRADAAALARPPIPAWMLGSLTAVTAALVAATQSPATAVFIVSSALLGLLVVAARVGHGPVDFFEPFWFFVILYVVGYGGKAALVVANQEAFVVYPRYYNPTDPAAPVLVAALVGLVSLTVGYRSRLHRPASRLIPDLGDRAVSSRRLVWASIIFLGLGLLALLVTAASAGVTLSPTSALFNVDTRRTLLAKMTGAGPVFILILVMPLFALTLFTALLARPLRARHYLVIFATTLVTAYCMSFIGGRIYLLGFLLGGLVLWHYGHRRIKAGTQFLIFVGTGVAASALGVILFPDAFSFSGYDLVRRLSGTFDGFELTRIAMSDVKSYFWGLTLFEDLFLTYVPRALVSAKPVIYGVVRAQEATLPGFYDAVGQTSTYPPSILAEGYLNFGWAGFVILPFLAGVALRALYEKGRELGGANLAILALTVGQMLVVIRSLGAFLAQLVIYSGFAFLAFRLHIPLRRHRLLTRS
ncbi:MAG: hypothetical protein ACRDZ7_01570 [Acidimicrobiia bacterium]